MPLPYANASLRRGAGDADMVRALQRDLRALGYLKQGIDGAFQAGTELAVRRLQYDLLNNDGHSTRNDGDAPVVLRDCNQNRVTAVDGTVDAGLAECIEELLNNADVPKLPSTTEAAAANRAARDSIAAAPGTTAPAVFLLAIFQQESGGRHYMEPTSRDADSFVVLGLDFQQATPDRVTSRGYGIGQYTLFHHPPRAEEVRDVITDPVRNAQGAANLLREKFDTMVLGRTAAARADDRIAEHPLLAALRLCRYAANDPRYMNDCQACAAQAGKRDLTPDTPVYAGATATYGQAQHHPATTYRGVPDRAGFLCDWPYAVRRYNGSGPDSYNYQAQVLLRLQSVPAAKQSG